MSQQKSNNPQSDRTLGVEALGALAHHLFSEGQWEGVPIRLVYEYLLESLEEDFDIITEGFWHLDGCTGYCPECFQRPWCKTGCQSCWPEDEQAGEMFLSALVKKYVSASPGSLSILQQRQAEEDHLWEEFQQTQGDEIF